VQQLLLRHSVVYIQICPHDPWYVLVSVCLCVYGSDSVGGQERQTLRERERLELGWAGGGQGRREVRPSLDPFRSCFHTPSSPGAFGCARARALSLWPKSQESRGPKTCWSSSKLPILSPPSSPPPLSSQVTGHDSDGVPRLECAPLSPALLS